MAIEPLTGKRIAMVYDKRRKLEYADFMKLLVPHFPKAEKIRLIQDNLNTHNSSSFYENMDAQKAYDLTQIFACVKEREKKKIKISWKFDITHARRKMNRHYLKLNSANIKFKKT